MKYRPNKLTTLAAFSAMVLIFQSCAVLDNREALDGGNGGEDGIDVADAPSDGPTLSILDYSQILPAYRAKLGVDPSPQAIALNELNQLVFPQKGLIKEFTVAVALALAGVAGEMCNKVFNDAIDGNEQIFLNGVNLKASSVNASELGPAYAQLAIRTWGRFASAAEQRAFEDFDTAVGLAKTTLTIPEARTQFLGRCTGFLTALEAIRN